MNAAVRAPVTTAREFNTVRFQERETTFCDDFFFFSFKKKREKIPHSQCLSSILASFVLFVKVGKLRQRIARADLGAKAGVGYCSVAPSPTPHACKSSVRNCAILF